MDFNSVGNISECLINNDISEYNDIIEIHWNRPALC